MSRSRRVQFLLQCMSCDVTAVQASAVLVKPGQFTGRKQLNALTPEDHKTGLQAWVKKVHSMYTFSFFCLNGR